MNKAILKDMTDRIKDENILNLIIMKDGEIIVDYNKREEYKRKLFKINSCTKSIVSALIGIAIENNEIENVNQPISDFFPELKDTIDYEKKKDIKLHHLLTMTSGLSWPEYGNWEFLNNLVNSSNWVKFILDRPIANNPGEVFNYNSGASHLLSAIISRSTGMNSYEYADKHIFKPLDIENITWMSDPQGNSSGGFGIEMSAYDLVKIGALYLNKGRKENSSLIPEHWIDESTKPKVFVSKSLGHYGYQWWIKDFGYYAMGNGGQFIFVIPDMNLVSVFISDNYKDSFRPIYYFKKYVLKMF